MATPHLRPSHWRKSSQWVALRRGHAALAVADRHVSEAFRRYCYTVARTLPAAGTGAGAGAGAAPAAVAVAAAAAAQPTAAAAASPAPGAAAAGAAAAVAEQLRAAAGANGSSSSAGAGAAAARRGGGDARALHRALTASRRPCVSDEHYVPTLLASYGLEGQTDCLGEAHYADWSAGGWHPRTFLPADLRPGQLPRAMWGAGADGAPACDGAAARASLDRLFCQQARAAAAPGGGEPGDCPEAPAAAAGAGSGSGGGDGNSSSNPGTHSPVAARPQPLVPPSAQGGAASANRSSGALPLWAPAAGPPAAGPQPTQAPGRQAPASSRGPTLRWWLERDVGYVPMGYRCHLFGRKFPGLAARHTFAFAMACEGGLGLAPWCGVGGPI